MATRCPFACAYLASGSATLTPHVARRGSVTTLAAADLARSHPGGFGLFPVVPLPDVEGSLREIEYGFDVLKASGIGIVTNYTDSSGSKWLGNPAFTPYSKNLA